MQRGRDGLLKASKDRRNVFAGILVTALGAVVAVAKTVLKESKHR